jgi:phenylalanyl-tRNA synthetase beta chain
MSKLHPTVQEAYDIPVTFIAEVDFDILMPKHIDAKAISKFQGVYKDLSIVIDKSVNYYEVAKVLQHLDLPMLKESYPIDIYTDEKLGEKKSIPLFEIGAVFDVKRHQSERVGVVFAGQAEPESVKNAGKPPLIDFATFTQKLGSVIGHFDLVPCSHKNGLIHPYQSADIVIDGKGCGFMSKLHPTVQEAYDIPVTFIAEVDFDVLMPQHINAKPISKFQGVYKDLSIVVEKSVSYYDVSNVLKKLDLPMLKESYPVDIYTDEKLGSKKSLTIRFFIQSMDKTLEEGDIDSVMNKIMEALQEACGAELR